MLQIGFASFFLFLDSTCKRYHVVFVFLCLTSLSVITSVSVPVAANGLRAVCSVVSDSCDPVDHSPSGSSVHGILQAGILEWVSISSSREGSSQHRDRTHVSNIGTCVLYY